MKILTYLSVLVFTLTFVEVNFADDARLLRESNTKPGLTELEINPFDDDQNDTLYYDQSVDNPFYFWTIPNSTDDNYYNVRFSPPFVPFRLIAALIPLYDIPQNIGGPIGNPGMKVIIYQSGSIDDESGYPIDALDSISVPYERLSFSRDELIWNYIDLRPLRFFYIDSVDFHIGVNVISRAEGFRDTLAVYSDRGLRRPTDRSGLWSGPDSTWMKMRNLPGIGRGFNFLIRALVANDSIMAVIEPSIPAPNVILLNPAYPNPFNSSFNVSFNVQPGEYYQLTLHDLTGRLTSNIASGTSKGTEIVSFEDAQLTGGTYFILLSTPLGNRWQKVTFLK